MEREVSAPNLTKQSIEALLARAAQENTQLELLDSRERGLRLRAGKRGATWQLVVRLKNGKRSRIVLGTWPGMGIAGARDAAQIMRSQIVQGKDPNAERRAAAVKAATEARAQVALKGVLDIYDEFVLSGQRSGGNTRRALDGKKGLLTTLSGRAISSITRVELGDLVKKHARKAPIGANRKLAYASAFFNWCVDEGILEINPLHRMRKPGKENERDRFHTIAELREIWAATGTLGYPFQQLYRLLIVMPNRREEMASMPVSPLARSLIIEARDHPDRPAKSKYLFSTTEDTPVSGFTKAKRRLDRAVHDARVKAAEARGQKAEAAEAMSHWTIHDLRTTFNTHACEMLDVPPHVADRILNHAATATRSKVMRIYNKSELFEPRRKALCDWADLLLSRVIENPDVTPDAELERPHLQIAA
jgi:integrase